jgi:hypothetical protein
MLYLNKSIAKHFAIDLAKIYFGSVKLGQQHHFASILVKLNITRHHFGKLYFLADPFAKRPSPTAPVTTSESSTTSPASSPTSVQPNQKAQCHSLHELVNSEMELYNFAIHFAKHYFDIGKLGLRHHIAVIFAKLHDSMGAAVATSESSTASPASLPTSSLTLASSDCANTPLALIAKCFPKWLLLLWSLARLVAMWWRSRGLRIPKWSLVKRLAKLWSFRKW